MNDIVIPYLKNNSGELEVCIALIKKNVPHRNIIVVEEKFHDVSHIDQIMKIHSALTQCDLTDDFYLFNDDFFVVEPVESIPYYHKGLLSDHLKKRQWNNYYTRALMNTLKFLDKDALSYEVHIPMLFNKYKLDFIISRLKDEPIEGWPLIRSYYGYLYNLGGEQIKDVKNIKSFVGKTFLSTSESSFRSDIGKYIRSKL